MSAEFPFAVKRWGGAGSDRRLILLHGGPGLNEAYFSPFLEPLAKHAEVLSYTQGVSGQRNLAGLLQEIAALIDHERPTFVLGHSFGAALALEYIRKFGEAGIKGLILCSWMHDYKGWLDDYCRRFGLNPHDIRIEEPKNNADFKNTTIELTEQYFYSTHENEGRELWSRTEFDADLYRIITREFFEDLDVVDVVSMLKIPVLSVAGTEDRMVGINHVRGGCARNSGIEALELQAAGHFPFVEKTREFVAGVREFIMKA